MQKFYPIIRLTVLTILVSFLNPLKAQVIFTVAGGGVGDGGQATSVPLSNPESVALDASGNLYIADANNNRVRKVTPAGVISTIAGTGTAGFNFDNIQATAAELNTPMSVSIDASGNVYILDENNYRVRKVNTSGIISTVVGNGKSGYAGNGGPATAASFGTSLGMALDDTGNIYILDESYTVIRKVRALTGIISTIAGNGSYGYSGDGGPATAAQITYGCGISFDARGDLYFADEYNYRIRMIDTTGIITTVVGNGSAGFSGDGGPAGSSSCQLWNPSGVTLDAAGNIFIADQVNNRIREVVHATGIINTIAGNGNQGYAGNGVQATTAELNYPVNTAVDGTGNLYIVDQSNNLIRKVNTSGIITTFAGDTVSVTYAGDGGLGKNAILNYPSGVARDKAGNIFFTDQSNNRVREYNTVSHIITTVAGNGIAGFSGDNGLATAAELNNPSDIAIDGSGNLYIIDNSNSRIRMVTHSTGIISTIAGTGTGGYSGENTKADTSVINPMFGIVVDSIGDIYFSESTTDIVRKITKSTGLISTVAGVPENSGYTGDSLTATSSDFSLPLGLTIDKAGNLYIVDAGNYLVRKLSATDGKLYTYAGQHGNANYNASGITTPVLATSIAAFYSPQGIYADTLGNVYVTDISNGSITEINKYDTISFVSGVGGVEGNTYNGDYIMANTSDLGGPMGITVDDSNNIFVAEESNNRLREIRVTGPSITTQPVGQTVCSSMGTKLSIQVSGTGNTYQWLVDSTGYGYNLMPITNGKEFSGANTDTLTIHSVNTFSLSFACVVNGGYIESSPVRLNVNSPPNFSYITTNYLTDSICPGQQITLRDTVNNQQFRQVHPTRKAILRGAPPYYWNNGDTAQSITVSPTKTTTYIAYTNLNCPWNDTITVLVSTPTVKAHSFPGTTVCNGTPVTLYGSGGTGYSWYDTSNVKVSNATGFSPSKTTMYYVNGMDQNGCNDFDSIVVKINPLPSVIATASKDSVCPGNSVTMTASGATSYSWSNGVSNGIAFVPGSSATYYVTGTDANGCSASTSVPVVVNSLPVITGTASPDAVCAGSSVTLAGNGGSSYSWSGGVTNNVPFVPTSSGTYTVTGTSAQGCSNTASVSITVNPKPAIVASAFPSATLCQGSSLALFGSGGASYAWTGGVNNGVSFTPAASAKYIVTGIDANGCTNKDSINVTVHNKVVPTVTSKNTSCGLKNGMASVSASNGIPPYSYSWTTVPASTNSYADSLAPGTYVVTVSDSADCSSTTAVSIGSSTAPILSVSSSNSNCGTVGTGSASVAVTGGTAPYKYMWNNGDTLTNDYNLKAGTYIITVTDVNNCSTFAPAIVSNANGPKIVPSVVDNIKCFGMATGAISVSISGGTAPYSYSWSNGATTSSISSLAAGAYQLTVMDADSCISLQNFTLTQPHNPVTLVTSSTLADCGLADGRAAVSVAGGVAPYTYAWNNGATSSAISSVLAGIYHLTVTDGNGCMDSVHVAVSDKTGPALTIAISGDITCGAGGAITISATGATPPYTYSWSNGTTGTSISNIPAGNYGVTVTDAHGCVSTADTSIYEAAPPAISICMVSVDPTTSKFNYVVWDKSHTPKIAFYNIYKETTVAGVYQKIASVPYSGSDTYTDSLSNPMIRSWRYEISQVDSCGNESPMSLPHKTMHLTVNQGVGNNINLIWDNYQGLNFSTYYVYRDTIPGMFTKIDSIPNNIFTYTDNSPLNTKKQLLYHIGIDNPGGCSPAIKGLNYSASKSNTGNISLNGSASVQNITSTNTTLQVYPNPSNGMFTISMQLPANEADLQLNVMNALGQEVLTRTYSKVSGTFLKQLDLSNLAKGVYFLKLYNNNSVTYTKVVIQ